MAIVTENVNINGRAFVKTTSDAGRFVVRDGVSYFEAFDPAVLGRTYTEGDLLPEESREVEAEELLNIILGEGDGV